MSAPGLLVGLDVGGTKIDGIVARQSAGGEVQALARINIPTGAHAEHGPTSVTTSIRQAIGSLLETAQRALDWYGSPLAAIGVGIPGQVQNGVVNHAVNLGMHAYALQAELQSEFDVPVCLENDVRLAAVGIYELYRAQIPGLQNLVYLSIGTGISAGVVVQGQLLSGSHGLAGEVGHIIAEPQGLHCKCGLDGCLETIAAGPGIAEQAGTTTAAEAFQQASRGDPVARAAIQRAAKALANTLYNLCMSYDPDLLVLGGGVSHAGQAFQTPLLAAVRELSDRSALAHSVLSEAKVAFSPAEFNAGMWGGVALAAQAASAGPFHLPSPGTAA